MQKRVDDAKIKAIDGEFKVGNEIILIYTSEFCCTLMAPKPFSM